MTNRLFYYGPVVQDTMAVAAAANGGQILLTHPVYTQVLGVLEEVYRQKVEYTDLGRVDLSTGTVSLASFCSLGCPLLNTIIITHRCTRTGHQAVESDAL